MLLAHGVLPTEPLQNSVALVFGRCSEDSAAAWAVPARTRSSFCLRFSSGVVSLPTPLGWKPMHQQPPKTPLFRSTRAANASHVDSSRALTVYVGFGTRSRKC